MKRNFHILNRLYEIDDWICTCKDNGYIVFLQMFRQETRTEKKVRIMNNESREE